MGGAVGVAPGFGQTRSGEGPGLGAAARESRGTFSAHTCPGGVPSAEMTLGVWSGGRGGMGTEASDGFGAARLRRKPDSAAQTRHLEQMRPSGRRVQRALVHHLALACHTRK